MAAPTHYDPSSASEEPLPAVACPVEPIIPEAVFFAPRTRRGHGAGVIQLLPPNLPQDARRLGPAPLDPLSAVKLAEEGFAVVSGCVNDGEHALSVQQLVEVGLETLEKRNEVDGKDRFAVLGGFLSICVPNKQGLSACSIFAGTSRSNPSSRFPVPQDGVHYRLRRLVRDFSGSFALSHRLLRPIAWKDTSPRPCHDAHIRRRSTTLLGRVRGGVHARSVRALAYANARVSANASRRPRL
jgi:hypothetical protein